jgi:hypothetical protein
LQNISNKKRIKKSNNRFLLTTLNTSKASRLYISKAEFNIIPDFVFKANASDGNNP